MAVRKLPTVDIVSSNPLKIATDDDVADLDDASQPTIKERVRRNRNTLASVGFSLVAHAMLLTILAFIFLNLPRNSNTFNIVAEISAPPVPEISESPIAEPQVEIIIDDLDNALVENESTDTAIDIEMPVPIVSTDKSNSTAADKSPVTNPDPVNAAVAPPKGGGLEGREKNARSSLAASRGGSAQSERAVELGLRWIAQHQREDGSWRFNLKECPCQGQCRDSGKKESTTAATGLALLAFLGAGYTHQTGPYQEEVQNGIDYLISRIRKTYFGGNLAEGSMYAQGIATLALSEALAMTEDESLVKHVQSTMDYIITAQHSKGGWRYQPGEPGDMTVTGWQIMALKSCELSKFVVPESTWDKANLFMSSVSESGGLYGYQDAKPQPTTTAIGLLIKMYQGSGRNAAGLSRGIDYMNRRGPSDTNIYFDYYATLVLHHYGGERWEQWNEPMRDFLIKSQSTKRHETGSWHFRDKHGNVGGRLYSTAMAIMILEVYYRYLPLYDAPAVDP